jgi:hypothetical protein
MSFNKKFVSPLAELIIELEKYPDHLRHYINADALIGPPESIKYIEKMWKLQEKAKLANSNEDSLIE